MLAQTELVGSEGGEGGSGEGGDGLGGDGLGGDGDGGDATSTQPVPGPNHVRLVLRHAHAKAPLEKMSPPVVSPPAAHDGGVAVSGGGDVQSTIAPSLPDPPAVHRPPSTDAPTSSVQPIPPPGDEETKAPPLHGIVAASAATSAATAAARSDRLIAE